jgi:hypothetical protein
MYSVTFVMYVGGSDEIEVPIRYHVRFKANDTLCTRQATHHANDQLVGALRGMRSAGSRHRLWIVAFREALDAETLATADLRARPHVPVIHSKSGARADQTILLEGNCLLKSQML